MGDLDIEKKPMADERAQANGNGLHNGLANGTSDHKDHHKSKDRDKDRDKSKDRHHDKDRHKSSHKDKDRDKERSKDKDRHSSSHKSSHKDKDRDKDRDKNRDKDKDRDRHRDKDKERSDKDKERSDKDKERSDKDKERSDKERSDKDKERSDKDKERNDKDKERSKDDKHRERSDKEKRDKDKERSDRHRDKDKDKSRDKDRDRHRDDKDKKSSSSSSSSSKDKKDKDRHHSSHKSSHKDKHRDRDSKHHTEKVKEEKPEPESLAVKTEIKPEPKSEIKTEEKYESVQVKDEPMDTSADFASQSMEDSQVSMESHVKEDSEDDSKLVIKEELPEENEEEEDDDIPLAARKRPKPDYNEEEEEDDDVPLISRKKVKKVKTEKKRKLSDAEDDDFAPAKKKVKKKTPKKGAVKIEPQPSPTKGAKKKKEKEKEEEQNVWKWWEEEKRDDGKKWNFLEHKGPVLADPYERLPSNVKFYYDGSSMQLSQDAEEAAGFYAKMLDHDYTTKELFNTNFFKDWRKTMTEKERTKITDLKKCNFRQLHAYYVQKNEERKNRTKEEKKILKEKNEASIKEYGWCIIDGHKQRIGNYKIEPPGLFRGRGEHPKQGKIKKRTMPEEVIINCSRDSNIPKPPAGHKWKEVRHDQAVTWLACWSENIQHSTKYVMLNAASKLKGEKDWQKYETARKLHKSVDKIRDSYRMDWKSKEMRIRQRGVALYFIDKLALRAGNEKDEDQADTVGCCSLRYEHLTLHEKKDGLEFVVVFDFLGKDSIRYFNEVPVEKRVFKNLQLFMENKNKGDDIFDRLNTQILNKYLNELLEGLTAKVFRTYNASRTLQEQLERMTTDGDPIPAQILSYNRANREVAILCNHQRAVPKTFDKSMANLTKKIEDKREVVADAERELKSLKKAVKHGGSAKDKMDFEKKKKSVERLKEQLEKLEISATDKEENKQIALGTSKLNYLDPRITVAWCKKNGIPIDKVYNKTQRQKFQWAIDMATGDFNFLEHDRNAKFKGKQEDEDGEEEEEED